MSAPFFWTVPSSLDIIQIANTPREQPRIRIAKYGLCGVVFALKNNTECELEKCGMMLPIIMTSACTYDSADSWSIGGKFIIFDVWSVSWAMSTSSLIGCDCRPDGTVAVVLACAVRMGIASSSSLSSVL